MTRKDDLTARDAEYDWRACFLIPNAQLIFF